MRRSRDEIIVIALRSLIIDNGWKVLWRENANSSHVVYVARGKE